MSRELVPELHDALKLTTLKHNFEDFGPFQPNAPETPTWRGVLQHHCDEFFPAYPTDRETFLLHMADGLASGFSRHSQNIQHDVAWTAYRLWNPGKTITDRRLATEQEIGGMLSFLSTDPSFDEFYARYQNIFQTRAEDAHAGMNITTLETHVRLVGRFYRFLLNSRRLHVGEDEVQSAVQQGIAAARGIRVIPGASAMQPQYPSAQLKPLADLRERKKREWQLHLIRCRPSILANPFRARDLNAFDVLEEFLDALKAIYADRLLFVSADEILLYSDDLDILQGLRELAGPRGISLEVQRDLQRLDDFKPVFRKPEFQIIYPALEPTLPPPICEICQMQSATRVWPDDYLSGAGIPPMETGTERLCETCFSIRSRPSKLTKLAHWEEWAEGDLIWAHFRLDLDHLRQVLSKLYLSYLRSLEAGTAENKAEVRFSLIGEFQRDYDDYLSRIRTLLRQEFGDENVEIILENFFCIRAESGSAVFSVLQRYGEALRAFFPAFLEGTGCPLRVSLAMRSTKYPFFEVWRHWQGQHDEIGITVASHGQLELKTEDLDNLLRLVKFPFRKSALHNLAEVSRVSQGLAELRFRAGGEKGERETFEHLKQFLPLGLTFDGILTLAKLVEN